MVTGLQIGAASGDHRLVARADNSAEQETVGDVQLRDQSSVGITTERDFDLVDLDVALQEGRDRQWHLPADDGSRRWPMRSVG